MDRLDGDENPSQYGSARSEILENVNSESQDVALQNALSINGESVEGYTNMQTSSMNLATVQNFTTDNNTQSVDTNMTSNVINEEQVVEEKEFPAHDFEKNLSSLLPKYDENTQDKVKGVYSSDEKQVFLTFDDGPSKITEEVLDVLKKYNVKATFFVLGSNVDLRPEITKRAYEEGHYIANHGYTHKYSSIYADPSNVLEEYEKTETAIQNAIGIKNYHSYLFRFPGGSSGGYYSSIKEDAKDLLEEYGVAYTNWSCLTGDAEGEDTVEEQLNRLYETAGDSTSLVILMHDAGDKKSTPETLAKIIEHYQAEGYTFKNYYDIMN